MKTKYRKHLLVILLFLFFLILPNDVFAATFKQYTGRVAATLGLNIRQEKNASSSIVGFLAYNSTFKYSDNDIYVVENSSCSSWIYVGSANGYVCGDYIEVSSTVEIDDFSDTEMAKMTEEEFDNYLNNEGFDDIYKEKLTELHKKYPSWIFKGVKTNRDWKSTVKEESTIGYSTYYMDAIRESAGHEAYLNTESHYDWTTNMFWGYDGTFFLANEQTVAYFLDPRNYLSESYMFVFETLFFSDTYQDITKIPDIIGTDAYTELIYNTGKEENYSPIALAVKIRQEGTLKRRPTLGTIDVNCTGGVRPAYKPEGTKYLAPLYNFFNIGADSSPSNADLNGLCFAATTNEHYLLPWNTEEKAIKGGTKWIADQYVRVGQYTNYFQKFNTGTPNTQIWHQYMTNIEDPKSQSTILYQLYSDNGSLASPFIFYIPIFDNMPDKTELPKPGNPNNWLANLTLNINGEKTELSNFSGDNTEYTIKIPSNINNVTINGTAVAKTSYVTIENTKSLKTISKQVALNDEENKFEIVVTAGNGDTKTYTLTVIMEAVVEEQPTIEEILDKANLKLNDNYISGISFGTGTSTLTSSLLAENKFATIKLTNNKDIVKNTGALGTGDKLTITSNNKTKTFEVVIFGDVNSDGEISNVDLLTVQKHIWKDTTLTGAYFVAADIDKDGKITNADLLRIQKHIWKDLIIGQN